MQDDASLSVEAFRQKVRAWLPNAIAEVEAMVPDAPGRDRQDDIRVEWGKLLYREGYAGLNWPAEYGGRDLEPAKSAVFSEECARAHAPTELNRIGVNLAGPAIIYAGVEAQKQRFLPPILRGEEIWCEGFSEPNAGSDLAAVSTAARFEGGKWLINGSKIWTSQAHRASRIYLLAKTSEDAPRHHNITVFLMDMKQPGVEVRPLRQINGRADFNQVFFTDAVAGDDERLGEVNGGWPLATIGAAGVRSMGAATAVWHQYAKIREMIDRLEACAAETGRIDHRVEGFRQELDLLWWHVARCAEMAPAAERFLKTQAATQVIKLHWSALFQHVADAGIALDCPHHRDWWRQVYFEARPTTLYGGSVQLQRNVIADQVLALRKRASARA